jgi:hypothetical protein
MPLDQIGFIDKFLFTIPMGGQLSYLDCGILLEFFLTQFQQNLFEFLDFNARKGRGTQFETQTGVHVAEMGFFLGFGDDKGGGGF